MEGAALTVCISPDGVHHPHHGLRLRLPPRGAAHLHGAQGVGPAGGAGADVCPQGVMGPPGAIGDGGGWGGRKEAFLSRMLRGRHQRDPGHMGSVSQCGPARHQARPSPPRSPSKRKMQHISNLSIAVMYVMYFLAALFGYLTFYGRRWTAGRGQARRSPRAQHQGGPRPKPTPCPATC